MKKQSILKVCNVISAGLLICFIIKTIIDYTRYSEIYSAPFYVYIIVNALYFVFPAIIIYIVRLVIKIKNNYIAKRSF